MNNGQTIWTIGHSTRSFEEFLSILESFNVKGVIDVRNFPGSRKYPHFNKESLELTLPAHNIRYLHIKSLGGRRKPAPDSKNTGWRSEAFRGYADYMETQAFEDGIKELLNEGSQHATAFMCSEAVWWRCHRSLIADYLKIRGWKVMHLMSVGKATEHPYTSAATIVDGALSYR